MTIKSLLTVCAVAAAVTGVRAQTVPFLDTAKPDHFIEIDVHAGDGASTITQNYSSAVPSVQDFVLTPGNRLIFGAGAILPVRNYFAIGTRLDIAINNYYWSMTIMDRNQGTLNTLYSRNRYTAAEVPVFMQLRCNLGSSVVWRSELGAYISFGLGGHSRYSEASSSTNSLGQSQVTETQYKNDYYDDSEPVINTFRKTYWGLHLGTGILAGRHFTLNVVMHAGARNLAKNLGVLDIRARTLNVTFTAGYQF